MKINEGKTDRTIRIILGIVFLGLALTVLSGTIRTILSIVGVVSLITGLSGFCLLYELLGINTNRNKK